MNNSLSHAKRVGHRTDASTGVGFSTVVKRLGAMLKSAALAVAKAPGRLVDEKTLDAYERAMRNQHWRTPL